MSRMTRRVFLGVAAAAALVPRWLAQAVAAVFPVRTVEVEDFAFDAGSGLVTRGGVGRPYALVVDGLVERPLRLDYAALRALPQTAMTADFHCVEGWSVPDVAWRGLRPATLMALARPRPEARYVILHALGGTRSRPGGLDHYVECLPLADWRNPALGYLLALELDGRPLPADHGAPLRLVCPFDLAYKAIKFVTRLEFSATAQDGWWTRANGIYTAYAPVEPERLRVPDPRTAR